MARCQMLWRQGTPSKCWLLSLPACSLSEIHGRQNWKLRPEQPNLTAKGPVNHFQCRIPEASKFKPFLVLHGTELLEMNIQENVSKLSRLSHILCAAPRGTKEIVKPGGIQASCPSPSLWTEFQNCQCVLRMKTMKQSPTLPCPEHRKTCVFLISDDVQ